VADRVCRAGQEAKFFERYWGFEYRMPGPWRGKRNRERAQSTSPDFTLLRKRLRQSTYVNRTQGHERSSFC
jgi:hypothetical protein